MMTQPGGMGPGDSQPPGTVLPVLHTAFFTLQSHISTTTGDTRNLNTFQNPQLILNSNDRYEWNKVT